jgi:hypothetical protein
MASALDRIIDGASDPSVSIANLLRSALAAAHRLGADTVREWVERELTGYDEGVERDELPVYRRGSATGVMAHWTGPFGTSANTTLLVHDVSDDAFRTWFEVPFRQPVSELEKLAASDVHPAIPWPAGVVGRWNSLAEQDKASRVDSMWLFSAQTMVEKSSIEGVLDAVRTEVLRLALNNLQDGAVLAGEAGRPTVDDPDGQRAVTTFHTHVYGGAPTFAQGTSVTQVVTVNFGDIVSLSQAAQGLGLSNEDLSDYVDAVLAAREEPSKGKLVVFLDRVRSGAVALGSGVAGNIAAEQLMKWATVFLGG